MIRCLFLFLIFATSSHAIQVFAKASGSKNNLAVDQYVLNLSGTTGFSFQLLPQIGLEFRYTYASSLQNYLQVSTVSAVGVLTDIYTENNLFSLGLDIDLVGGNAPFQPYIYLGVGYIISRRQSYFTPNGSSTVYIMPDPKKSSITGNAGLGFRIRIGKNMAIELEAVGYATNLGQPSILIDLFGTAGIRIFI
jgi:hypothetical protein